MARTSDPQLQLPLSRQPVEDDPLAMRVARMVHEMRPQSRYWVEQAVDAYELDGVTATLAVTIDAKRSARAEAHLSGGNPPAWWPGRG